MSAETTNDKDKKAPAQPAQAPAAKRTPAAKRPPASKPAAPAFPRRRVWPD